jgi:hypothetical protein
MRHNSITTLDFMKFGQNPMAGGSCVLLGWANFLITRKRLLYRHQPGATRLPRKGHDHELDQKNPEDAG